MSGGDARLAGRQQPSVQCVSINLTTRHLVHNAAVLTLIIDDLLVMVCASGTTAYSYRLTASTWEDSGKTTLSIC